MATSPSRGKALRLTAAREWRDERGPDGALRLSHEMLASIVSSAPVGIAIFEDGRCGYVNDYGRRMLGAATPQEAAREVDAAGLSPGRLSRCWPGLEFREIRPAVAAGQRIIAFQSRPEPRLPGLSWAVAGMAESGSLVGALDAIALEVKDNLRLAAANIGWAGNCTMPSCRTSSPWPCTRGRSR